ncbi:MAG: hypothetical protein RMJ88_02845, partial [Thermogemmata sp.]|nr:hypothetical protein [Thermogemmata sp.]
NLQAFVQTAVPICAATPQHYRSEVDRTPDILSTHGLDSVARYTLLQHRPAIGVVQMGRSATSCLAHPPMQTIAGIRLRGLPPRP